MNLNTTNIDMNAIMGRPSQSERDAALTASMPSNQFLTMDAALAHVEYLDDLGVDSIIDENEDSFTVRYWT